MVALVTGASDGIGKSIAIALARRGYQVYGISRKAGSFSFMRHLQADVRDRSQLKQAVDSIYEQAGNIDLLVACAGISMASPSMETDWEEARDIFDVNFWGMVSCTEFILPRMKAAREGRVIYISSMTGLLPIPYLSFYSSSKAAVTSYACATANECRPFRVKVSVLLPGGVQTQLTDKRLKYHTASDPMTQYALSCAICTLSREEQTGLPADQVAQAAMELLDRRHPPIVVPVGGWYRFYALLQRLLPSRPVLYFLRKKYSV